MNRLWLGADPGRDPARNEENLLRQTRAVDLFAGARPVALFFTHSLVEIHMHGSRQQMARQTRRQLAEQRS